VIAFGDFARKARQNEWYSAARMIPDALEARLVSEPETMLAIALQLKVNP
jgi:hypothetical protein